MDIAFTVETHKVSHHCESSFAFLTWIPFADSDYYLFRYHVDISCLAAAIQFNRLRWYVTWPRISDFPDFQRQALGHIHQIFNATPDTEPPSFVSVVPLSHHY